MASHPGRPHVAGHQSYPPASAGHSRFDGNVGVDHGAVSRLNHQNFALRHGNQQLLEANRGLTQTASALSARPDISHQELGELQDAAKQTYQMTQKEARAREVAIGFKQESQRMAQYMGPMAKELDGAAADLRQVKEDNKTLEAVNTKLNTSLQKVTTELDEAQLQLVKKLSEVEELTSQLTAERFHNESLETQLETATQEAQTARSLVEELRVEKHDLEKQLAQLSKTNDSQDRQIRYLNEGVKKGKDALEGEKSISMDLKRQLLSLRSSESQLQTQLDTTKSSLQRSQEQLVESERSLRGTQEKLENTQLEADRLNQKLLETKREYRDNKQFAREVQAKLNEYAQTADSLQADLADSKRSVENLMQKVSEKRDEVKNLRHALQDSRKSIEVLEKKVQQQQLQLGDMDRLKAELGTVSREREDLDQRNLVLTRELSEVHKREQDVRDLHHGAITQKRTLEQTLQKKEQLIARHESSIQECEREIESLRSEVSELRLDLATAKSEGSQEITEQLRAEIEGKDQQISELQSMQRSSQSNIEWLNEQITDLEIRLQDSEQLSNERAETLERQERLMQEGEVTIRQLRDQVAAFSGELASVQEGIQTLRSEHTVTRNILDQNLDSLASCQEIARQLDEIVSHPNPEAALLLSKLKEHISGVSAGFNSVAENLQRDSAKLDSLQSRTDGLEESATRKSVSFEDQEHVSVRSTTSSMSETKTSGLDHVPYEMLDSSNRPIGQGLLSGKGSTVVHLQSITVEDGSRTDSPRPGHLLSAYRSSQSGVSSARHGDGIDSSSDGGVRRHPERQGFYTSSDRTTRDLLRHDLDKDNESFASFDAASIRSQGRDTLDLRNRPIPDDSDSDG
ncbi:hypothetical protein [Endozoicomonas atrinae]|uniref:hypothetical protein n=1 Tax=Endozoicomonas atrinae TaxID=1333660 RepID=UPI001112E69E|nr:hypothetical protein [Endozoicomonas atrinae]